VEYGCDDRSTVSNESSEDHARWLVSNETVLILQGPIETLRFPVAVLRESGDIPPAVFVLHPKRENPIGDVRSSGVPLSPTQIQEPVVLLAFTHELVHNKVNKPSCAEPFKLIAYARKNSKRLLCGLFLSAYTEDHACVP